MFEWLTGDALSGIYTTVGFFTFLLVGRRLGMKKCTI